MNPGDPCHSIICCLFLFCFLGISVYYLSGKAEWYQDAGAAFDMIDEIAEYNNNHDDHKVAGITLDIEPYTLSA